MITMVNVRFEGVSKRYEDGFEAVSAWLEVKDGEFLVLLGPSDAVNPPRFGCLQDLRRTEGAVSIDGVVVNHLPAGGRGLEWCFSRTPSTLT